MICPVCKDEKTVAWVVNLKTITTVKVPCPLCCGKGITEVKLSDSVSPPLRCYYAHCKNTYGLPQEKQDISWLKAAGFNVINPSDKEIVVSYEAWLKENSDAIAKGKISKMDFWLDLVKEEAEVLAFRAAPNGKITSGVAKEIQAAQDTGIPVLELPSMIPSRTMTYEETVRYLQESGQR